MPLYNSRIINSFILLIKHKYSHVDITELLSYPMSYVEKESLPCDKTYLLWILNLRHSDDYFEYCEGLFRSVKKAP